jgi:hypothetical protein
MAEQAFGDLDHRNRPAARGGLALLCALSDHFALW